MTTTAPLDFVILRAHCFPMFARKWKERLGPGHMAMGEVQKCYFLGLSLSNVCVSVKGNFCLNRGESGCKPEGREAPP